MTPSRAVAGLVVLAALIGIGYWVKTDMAGREQPPHVRAMAESMRALREAQGPFGPSFGTASRRDVQEAARAFERAMAEMNREMAVALARTRTLPAGRAALLANDDGPPPAPVFDDLEPARPEGPRPNPRVGFVATGGEYVVLDDGTTWRVEEAGREAALGWQGGEEVIPSGARLRRPDGTSLSARRILSQSGRSVRLLEGRGTTVTLDDGSVWHVEAEDRTETASWEPGNAVVVLPDALLNADRAAGARARHVR